MFHMNHVVVGIPCTKSSKQNGTKTGLGFQQNSHLSMGHNLKAEWCFALTSKLTKTMHIIDTVTPGCWEYTQNDPEKTRLGIQKRFNIVYIHHKIICVYIYDICACIYIYINICISTNFPIPEFSLPSSSWAPLKHLESSRLRAARARHSGRNVHRVRRRRKGLERFVVPPPGGSRPYRSSIWGFPKWW